MTNILVTGGAGGLGRHIVTTLVEQGYTVRIMSRRPQPASLRPGTQWTQADIATGQGLAEAVAGIDTIIHAASDPGHAKQIDVEGTRLLLDAARVAGVAHIVYISIVGIDRIPFAYYRHKLATEKIIEQSGIPWTILRATQFHSFVDILLRTMTKVSLLAIVPTNFKAQTIDVGEVAQHLCEAVKTGPSGRLPDLGGPQVMTLGEMAKTWLKARGMHRIVLPLWIPGALSRSLRAGYNTCPEEALHGNVTWDEWLQKRYRTERNISHGDSSAGKIRA